jgi:hypothetical protein
MSEKVYEMYDDYYQAQAQLLELIEARDYLKESLKTAHPSKLADGYMMLNAANKKIEACEAALANEYETHQKACRSREAYDKSLDELSESVDAAYIYFKHRHPDRFKAIQAQFYNGRTPEEIEEFEDRIAILEATRLEEFIGKDDGSPPSKK